MSRRRALSVSVTSASATTASPLRARSAAGGRAAARGVDSAAGGAGAAQAAERHRRSQKRLRRIWRPPEPSGPIDEVSISADRRETVRRLAVDVGGADSKRHGSPELGRNEPLEADLRSRGAHGIRANFSRAPGAQPLAEEDDRRAG